MRRVAENAGAADAPPLTPAEVEKARTLYGKDFGL